jgi:hypothetical protein
MLMELFMPTEHNVARRMLLGKWNLIVSARQFGFLLVPAKPGYFELEFPFW